MKMIRKDSNTPILDKEMNGVRYLQFPALLELEVCRHLFSTRIGGVSQGDLGSMNLSYTRGDKKENVDENFRRIAQLLECEPDDFVLTHQTHTTNVRTVTEEDKGYETGSPEWHSYWDGTTVCEYYLATGDRLVTKYRNSWYDIYPYDYVIGSYAEFEHSSYSSYYDKVNITKVKGTH